MYLDCPSILYIIRMHTILNSGEVMIIIQISKKLVLYTKNYVKNTL